MTERWLTTRSVDALSVASETLFRDRELAGFGVVVEPSGRKTYVMELAAADGVRRVALGRHGTVSADRARKQAAALLAGDAPAETTVAELARRYMREYVEVRCKPATVAQYRLTIDRHILPALGGAAIAAIGREQVAALQHGLADRPATANQAIATLARLIEQAADWGLVPPAGNPCRSVPRYRVRRRERFLTEPEFRRLGAALDALEAGGGISVHAAAAIRLLALTGCRRNEILTLRWDRRAARCRRAPAARFEDRAEDGADLPGGGENPWRTAEKSRGIRGSCRAASRARRYRASSCNGAAREAWPGSTTSGCTTSATPSPAARWRSARACRRSPGCSAMPGCRPHRATPISRAIP